MITQFVGNLSPSIRDTIRVNDVPVDLTGASVRFRMRRRGETTLTVDQPAVIVGSPVNGAVQYDWHTGETDTPGVYMMWWSVTLANGRTQDTPEAPLHIVQHGVPSVAETSGSGPCAPWVTADEVADAADTSDTDYDFSYEAAAASTLLYELSGRRYGGACTVTARPCNTTDCWGSPASRVAAAWTGYGWGYGSWSWTGSATMCGCLPLSRVKLAGYPVTSIGSVTIDGVAVDPATYRLDEKRWLTRLDGFWPACQDMTASLSAAGSFGVTYTYGLAPPLLGKLAAKQLAVELYKFANPGDAGDCALPEGAVTVSRQGVMITRETVADLTRQGRGVGLFYVDSFLRQVNPYMLRRSAAVWSPDAQQPAKIV